MGPRTRISNACFVSVALAMPLFAFGQDPHAGHKMPDMGGAAKSGEGVPAKPARSLWDPTIGQFDGLKAATAPAVVELEEGKTFELRASIVKQIIGGKTFRRFAYNGSIPGPLFKVRQGVETKIRFVNETDVETSIHSHGLRHDYRMDGAIGISQPKAVQPGETFEYVLKFPDAGMFWYHPHVREDYQQDMGLMGNFLVEPKSGAHWASVDREEILMLDDVLAKAPVPYPTDVANHAIMGRYGDTLLVNGLENARLSYRPGETVRLFVTNAANTRTFKLMVHGAQMKLVGTDLSPFEKEIKVSTVTIAPGERYVVEVKFPSKGAVELMNHTPQGMAPLVIFEAKGEPVAKSRAKFSTLRSNAALKKEMTVFVARGAKAKPRILELGVAMGGGGMKGEGFSAAGADHTGHGGHAGHGGHGGHAQGASATSAAKDVPWVPADAKIEWEDGMKAMNEASTSDSVLWKMTDAEGRTNMDVNWPFRKGEAARILIDNSKGGDHPMQHPIHFHGQRFVVLSVNGKKVTNRAWKDTVLVGLGDKVEILLDASNPGKWMAHCHIAEHLTSGMMTGFEVK